MGMGTNNITAATAGNFVPEMWSDETLAAFKTKTVLANLVTNINFKGKKGDTLHIPVPVRGAANAKAVQTQVVLNASSNTSVDVLIDKWFEYSVLYEDMAEMQALASMRKFFTDDAGYALAKKIDQHLHLLGAGLQGGTLSGTGTTSYEKAVLGGDGTTLFSGATPGNGTALTDAGLRRMIQTLEDSDVDSSSLSLILPPVEANVLKGIARFTEQAFRGDGNTLRTGGLGTLYGVDVYVSTNCPWVQVDAGTSTQAVKFTSTAHTTGVDDIGETVTVSGAMTNYRAGMLLSKDAIALAIQQGVRTQSQYKQEYLGTLVTADTVYGVKELRDYAGIAFIVPA